MSTSPSRSSRPAAYILFVSLAAIAAIAFGVLAHSYAAPAFELTRAPSSATPPSNGSISPFDDANPAIANLRPELRDALQQAAAAARRAGFDLVVNSGWRTPEEQARLLSDALVTYGSREEASRWVAPPEKSAHVIGEAVDVGDLDASVWLGDNGADFGLCRTYENERWHFEYRPEAVGGQCPAPYVDASHDPRLK